jgi:hypothetical protein
MITCGRYGSTVAVGAGVSAGASSLPTGRGVGVDVGVLVDVDVDVGVDGLIDVDVGVGVKVGTGARYGTLPFVPGARAPRLQMISLWLTEPAPEMLTNSVPEGMDRRSAADESAKGFS